MFFVYEDRNNDDSEVFAFSDRQGNGNNPSSAFKALGHNAMMAHSIRGRVDTENEGPRYCVACHLTDDGMAAYGSEYTSFKNAMETGDWGALNFPLLKQHIGQNTGNQLDSPLWVHMVAGLGSGLYLFDENGCAVNPLDDNDDRYGCDGNAPADNFNPANVVFNLDRLVETNGQPNSSSNHPLLNGPTSLRTGAYNTNMAGPARRELGAQVDRPDDGHRPWTRGSMPTGTPTATRPRSWGRSAVHGTDAPTRRPSPAGIRARIHRRICRQSGCARIPYAFYESALRVTLGKR